jgi:threonine dehydrogenase-like Zn-dependent dehydrogenase
VSVGSQVDFIIGLDNHSVVNGATKFTATINTVPEPSTFVLLGMGAVGLLGFAWRRRKRATV